MSGGNIMQSLPDMNQLLKLAASPAGQRLISMLQADTSIDLKKLAQNAADEDFSNARDQLSSFLASEEARSLIRQLEKSNE
jgi:hypothetical protein